MTGNDNQHGGNQHGPATESRVGRFDSAYEEAVALTSRLRDYVAAQNAAAVPPLSGVERGKHTRATSHLTARLLEMVAWLATQKAVQGGEMSAAEGASAECHVAPWGEEWAALSAGGDDELLPELAELVVQGRELHHRVQELGA